MGIINTAKIKMQEAIGEKGGITGDRELAGMRDSKPYDAYYSNGLFKGYDDRLWLYFKFPEDVQVEWTKTYRESADNQSFLTNIFDKLGSSIFEDSESTKKDQRIHFHIAMVRELSETISKYEGITPAHADFLDRMGGFSHPVWHSYFGVELLKGDINSDVSGITNKMRNYLDVMFNKTDIEYHLYKESIELISTVCRENGMQELDFSADPEDFERLTAWYGQSDSYYNMKREMTSTPMYVPEHGKSILVGGQELSFSSVKPLEARDMFYKDPFDAADVRFGTAVLRPSLNTVQVNIRGQIRSPKAAKNVFNNKIEKNQYNQNAAESNIGDSSATDKRRLKDETDNAYIAANAAYELNAAWLDNVEITLANIVDGKQSSLSEALSPYGLDAVNITKRQHTALCSTVPCYPRPIYAIPKGNSKRNPNVNNFYSGVLSLSGLFRSTKPAASGGVLLGLSDAGYEYKEIFTEIDAPKKYSAPPTILVTGATGSGKALTLDTKIYTKQGYQQLKDIKVGDQVYGADGKLTTVTYITPTQYNRNLFEINFSNNKTIKADSNHQWVVVDVLLSALSEKEKQNLIDFNLSALETLTISNENTIKLEELTTLFKETGAQILGWDNVNVLKSSLEFVDVYPIKGNTYNTQQVVEGLKTRIKQRLDSSKSWKEESVVRINTGELYYSDYNYNNEPRFVIPTINPINNDNDSDISNNYAYLLGLLSTGQVSYNEGTYRPREESLHYHSVDNEEQTNRITQVLDSFNYDYIIDDYGYYRFNNPEEVLEEFAEIYSNITTIHNLDTKYSFIRGMIDGSGYNDNDIIIINNNDYNDNIRYILESTGFIVQEKDNNDYFVIDNDNVLSTDNDYITIDNISPIESEPVRCLSVDNDTKTYLIDGMIPTSNTVQMLSMIAQTVYQGKKAVFLNPKPNSSLKPFFDLLGGETINMSSKYLEENPGKLDPMFFLNDRESVGRLLAEMIIKARGFNVERSAENNLSMEELTTELIERAKMPANQCSYDIIFGNQRAEPSTPRLSDDATVSFVRSRMISSPFWKATISKDPDGRSSLQDVLKGNRPILIEWDNSIVLPSKDSNPDKFTPAEQDGIQSITNLFDYGSSIIGEGKQGGILCIDEAHVLKTSETAMNKVRGAGRQWRSQNITLMIATQEMKDFLGDHEHNIGSYVRLFIIMKVDESDPKEVELFFDRTKLPKDGTALDYITNAGMKTASNKVKKSIPNAYIIDNTYEWQGGIICGPWPERELKAASSSDKVKTNNDRDIEDE